MCENCEVYLRSTSYRYCPDCGMNLDFVRFFRELEAEFKADREAKIKRAASKATIKDENGNEIQYERLPSQPKKKLSKTPWMAIDLDKVDISKELEMLGLDENGKFHSDEMDKYKCERLKEILKEKGFHDIDDFFKEGPNNDNNADSQV